MIKTVIALSIALSIGCKPQTRTFGATAAVGPAVPVQALDQNGNPLGTAAYPIVIVYLVPDGGL